MPIDVLMPALSPAMEKGRLTKWLKKEGEAVQPGDVLAEIETDKATMEVEAAAAGVLVRIVVPAGTADVPVDDLIALIAAEGEDAGRTGAPPAAGPTSPTDSDAAAEDARPAGANGAAETAGAATPAPGAAGGRLFASPLARRLAGREGIDLAAVTGSGPRGRVIERDVRTLVEDGQARSAAAPPAAMAAPTAADGPAPGAGADPVKGLYAPGSYEEVMLDGMRRTIARRLAESKRTVPHFYLSLDLELDALLSLRAEINASAPAARDGSPAYRLSVNDFVVKALALALQRVPDANAVFADDRILRFRHSDVGVAVAVPGGLFTPVIRRAEAKTLSALSAEIKDLAARARAKKLRPEEYQGGATAVSNLGMHGVRSFQAIINPPQSTILAVGAGEARVVARDGAPCVVQAMTVTLAIDHRVIDGALGAELLAAFKGLIERPAGMLV